MTSTGFEHGPTRVWNLHFSVIFVKPSKTAPSYIEINFFGGRGEGRNQGFSECCFFTLLSLLLGSRLS